MVCEDLLILIRNYQKHRSASKSINTLKPHQASKIKNSVRPESGYDAYQRADFANNEPIGLEVETTSWPRWDSRVSESTSEEWDDRRGWDD